MSKPYDEKLEAYRQLRERHPDETLRFFAEYFNVNQGTVSRWNKALKKQSIKEEAIDELETRLRKEYEAKLQGILDEKEQEREEAERKKQEDEELASTNRRQYFKNILDRCATEDIYPSETTDVTWQGFRFTLIGGVKNTVPEVIAGVWRDSQKQKQQATQTIERYKLGQFLGKMGRVR